MLPPFLHRSKQRLQLAQAYMQGDKSALENLVLLQTESIEVPEIDSQDSVLGYKLSDLIAEHEAIDQTDMTSIADLLHRTSRVLKVVFTNAYEDTDFVESLQKLDEPIWSDQEKLGVSEENIKAVADQLFKSSKALERKRVTIMRSGLGNEVVERVMQLCLENDIDFDVEIGDVHFDHALIEKIEGPENEDQTVIAKLTELFEQNELQDELRELKRRGLIMREPMIEALLAHSIELNPQDFVETALERLARLKNAQFVEVYTSIPVAHIGPTFERTQNRKTFGKLASTRRARAGSGDMHYSLTLIPSKKDAEIDQMDYREYLDFFFESCDQPWGQVHAAQEILKTKFNAAKELHITNDDGTDVSLNIDGMTFANSVVAKNLPGSELFSAPQRNGVNGKLVAIGRFQYGSSPIMEDIELHFEQGRIIEWKAKTDEQTVALGEIITRDDEHGEGVRYIGEIGIGTNRHIDKHIINGLLVEKIGGSFHLALGNCYTYEVYEGEPVNLKNGNESHSGVHWDLTTMLRDRGGKMYLDGDLVQDDGDWVLAAFTEDGDEQHTLSVLNQGWAALSEADRPEWFKTKFPEGY